MTCGMFCVPSPLRVSLWDQSFLVDMGKCLWDGQELGLALPGEMLVLEWTGFWNSSPSR